MPQFVSLISLIGCAAALGLFLTTNSDRALIAKDELVVAPGDQRRLTLDDLAYKGAFRVPADESNDDTFAGGGQAIAFNPTSSSLFVSSAKGNLAEVSIPSLAMADDAGQLPVAKLLQGFAEPTEGRLSEIGQSAVILGGLLVHEGQLYGTVSTYYDAQNEQRFSHFVRSLRLSERSFRGWTQVWDTGKTGFVSGWLANVPVEWRALLGGAVATGQCCIPIISRTSWGPSAFAFDPGAIGSRVAHATPLLYYSQDHPTLGQWGETNERFGNSTEVGGFVIVDGTRSALYFGRTGLGEACYGKGTADRTIVGTIDPEDGGKWCLDPTSPYKGTHAYPYRYQIWAYDLNDFTAVKSGKRRPWDVVPYGVWPLEFPTAEPRTVIGGIGYDPARRMIYVSQRHADRDEYQSRPVIHAFQVR